MKAITSCTTTLWLIYWLILGVAEGDGTSSLWRPCWHAAYDNALSSQTRRSRNNTVVRPTCKLETVRQRSGKFECNLMAMAVTLEPLQTETLNPIKWPLNTNSNMSTVSNAKLRSSIARAVCLATIVSTDDILVNYYEGYSHGRVPPVSRLPAPQQIASHSVTSKSSSDCRLIILSCSSLKRYLFDPTLHRPIVDLLYNIHRPTM